MKLSNIKNIEFWAREYRLPLFWLTDKNRALVEDNCLCFYKNSVLHLYLLNNRYKQEVESGYRYFNRKGGFSKYGKLCEQTIDELTFLASRYQRINTKQLSTKELQKLFDKFLRVLNRYSEIYKKTEETKLKKFEGVKNKGLESKLQNLGKLRLKMRKAGESIFYILLGKIMKEMAKRAGTTVNNLFFYTRKELGNLFKGKKLNNKILLNRKRGYVLWMMNGRIKILTDKKFREMWRWINKKFIAAENQIINGTTANKGRAMGKVRLILHKTKNLTKQIAQFEKGEILVTEMTRPDTIVACRNAAAIITDEGGITCHAAIVSREFNIPCVIGTKIATQVLKDGYLVEVDADSGKVKILEK